MSSKVKKVAIATFVSVIIVGLVVAIAIMILNYRINNDKESVNVSQSEVTTVVDEPAPKIEEPTPTITNEVISKVVEQIEKVEKPEVVDSEEIVEVLQEEIPVIVEEEIISEEIIEPEIVEEVPIVVEEEIVIEPIQDSLVVENFPFSYSFVPGVLTVNYPSYVMDSEVIDFINYTAARNSRFLDGVYYELKGDGVAEITIPISASAEDVYAVGTFVVSDFSAYMKDLLSPVKEEIVVAEEVEVVEEEVLANDSVQDPKLSELLIDPPTIVNVTTETAEEKLLKESENVVKTNNLSLRGYLGYSANNNVNVKHGINLALSLNYDTNIKFAINSSSNITLGFSGEFGGNIIKNDANNLFVDVTFDAKYRVDDKLSFKLKAGPRFSFVDNQLKLGVLFGFDTEYLIGNNIGFGLDLRYVNLFKSDRSEGLVRAFVSYSF